MTKDATSDVFLERVTQNVPLNELKKVIKSCYFDENMNFAALVSEIINDDLKKLYSDN